MLFKAVYPALVRGIPPRRPSETLCVVRQEVEIEIPEIAVKDAPHVMTVAGTYVREVSDWGGPVPVRQIAGRYYRPLLTVEQFAEALSDPLEPTAVHSDRVLARSDVFEGLRSKIKKALFGYEGPNLRFWPTDIEHVLRQQASSGRNLFSSATQQFRTAGGKIALDEAAQAQADQYRDAFVCELSEHVVIDGCVWHETPEPVYVVGINGLMTAAFPESLARLPQRSPDSRVFDAADHFFPADCREEALEFAREHCRNFADLEHMLSTTMDSIEVVNPTGLSGRETISLGLLAAARDLRGKLSHARMTAPGLAALSALDEAIEASDPRKEISPGLEGALNGAVALWEADPRFTSPQLNEAYIDQLRLHIYRQDDLSCAVAVSQAPKR